METTKDNRTLHTDKTGPDYRDEDGQPARIVRCPDCGQMEWWTERECQDHGRCRAYINGPMPCEACLTMETQTRTHHLREINADLLAALEAFLADDAACQAMHDAGLEAWMTAARAAIAKARGQ